MTWCNRFEIHYLFDDILGSFLSILIPCIILYGHSSLPFLHCTWLECINSCTKDLSHGFLVNRWLVENRFMCLGNPLEVVVHHLLSEGWLVLAIMMCFHGECTSVCIVTHWTGPTVSHDWRLSSSHVMISPNCFIMLFFNLERILNLC